MGYGFSQQNSKRNSKILGTSLTKGLEPNEVVNRLKEYGKNKLSQAKNSHYNTVFKSV